MLELRTSTVCILIALTTLQLGCKTPPQPTTENERVPQQTEPAKSLPPATLTAKPLDEAAKKNIFTALGCPAEAITATGCKVCPTAVRYWTNEYRMDSSPDVEIKLEQGQFTSEETSGRQVLAHFEDCQEPLAGGDVLEDFTHLVEQQDGSWKLMSTVTAEGVTKCYQIPVTETHTRTLCESYSGRMGDYEVFYNVFSWDGAEVSEGELPSPPSTLLVIGRELGLCEENLSIGHAITREDGDVNGDGLQDITLKIRTVAGPWTQPLTECNDGDMFEAPLEPAREKAESTYELVYLTAPDGYREKDNKSSTIPMPAGYESDLAD
tara:strand:+ start:67 stop:1035 length:969 start_codon:yes stop_codon:yes gene_type:complete